MNELTSRQRTILAYIAHFTQKTGYPPTVREIGAHFRIASSSVFDHLKALEGKGALRRKSGKSRSLELPKAKGPNNPAESAQKPGAHAESPAEIVHVPVIGEIAAGRPLLAEEHIQGTVPVARQWAAAQKVFALRVRGDSMINDGIHEGDQVLVQMQPDARDGDIVVALLPNGLATLKRIYFEKDRIKLMPANATMSPIFTTHVKIQGKVVGLIRRYSA